MSRPRTFRKLNSGDDEVQQLQANIEQAIAPVIKSPILNGVLLTNVSIVFGDNKIEHKLGRKMIGYFVIARAAGVTLFDSVNGGTDLDKFLTLNSSGTTTISLWIF